VNPSLLNKINSSKKFGAASNALVAGLAASRTVSRGGGVAGGINQNIDSSNGFQSNSRFYGAKSPTVESMKGGNTNDGPTASSAFAPQRDVSNKMKVF